MIVEIQFKDGSFRKQYHVKDTWLDGCLFCLQAAYMVVHKYPVADIRRIKEIKDPTPEGESPDFEQIRKDFGYDV